jgi:two-component system, OmpR family, alkaline phosphatase synthesis response regulator PhoP
VDLMNDKDAINMPKVLVVDDDPDLVAICSLVLEYEGYQIDVARNGVEAYETVTSDGVDVVLMDVMMPVMDGITVCKMMKRDPKTKDLPVIIMSASETLREQARTAAADAVIAKPFDIDNLVTMVNQFAVQ